MMHLRHASLVVSLCAPLAAQQSITIPATAALSDAPSIVGLPGIDVDGRFQLVLDATAIGPGAVGHDVTALTFRRDQVHAKALQGGASTMTVVVSSTLRNALSASESFADNLDPLPANRVQVFTGTLAIPASADTSSRTVSWSDPQDVIRIPFATPFHYAGGNLCVDITGARVVGQECDFWPVDAVLDTAVGSVVDVGQSCVPPGTTHRPAAAYVDPRALVAGASALFAARGAGQHMGALLFGTPLPSFDLSLLGIGAPQCTLDVNPFATVLAPVDGAVGAFGTCRVGLRMPNDVNTLSLSFRAQFVVMTTPLSTSNALDVSLAASIPTLGTAMVRAFDSAGTGRVLTGRTPVVQIEVN